MRSEGTAAFHKCLSGARIKQDYPVARDSLTPVTAIHQRRRRHDEMRCLAVRSSKQESLRHQKTIVKDTSRQIINLCKG